MVEKEMRTHWLTIAENGYPQGVVCLNLDTEEILCLLVDNNHRRKGVGTKLIKQLEEYARAKGLKRVHATAVMGNKASIGLFRSLGYNELVKFEKKL